MDHYPFDANGNLLEGLVVVDGRIVAAEKPAPEAAPEAPAEVSPEPAEAPAEAPLEPTH